MEKQTMFHTYETFVKNILHSFDIYWKLLIQIQLLLQMFVKISVCNTLKPSTAKEFCTAEEFSTAGR